MWQTPRVLSFRVLDFSFLDRSSSLGFFEFVAKYIWLPFQNTYGVVEEDHAMDNPLQHQLIHLKNK
jgi:hypothetical protein